MAKSVARERVDKFFEERLPQERPGAAALPDHVVLVGRGRPGASNLLVLELTAGPDGASLEIAREDVLDVEPVGDGADGMVRVAVRTLAVTEAGVVTVRVAARQMVPVTDVFADESPPQERGGVIRTHRSSKYDAERDLRRRYINGHVLFAESHSESDATNSANGRLQELREWIHTQGNIREDQGEYVSGVVAIRNWVIVRHAVIRIAPKRLPLPDAYLGYLAWHPR